MLALLALFGLLAGIGITAVGPGGVLATIGLFALTALSPEQVAGTALITHLATGGLGTLAYTSTGQLREPGVRRIAVILTATAAVGAPVGVVINAAVSPRAFGLMLAALAVCVGWLVWYRDRHAAPAVTSARLPVLVLGAVGFAVAVAGGMFGIGGPMLAVPLLVALAVPVLGALAAAQVQSVVIAGVGSLGYLAHHAIDWPLAGLVGLPELCGVLIGAAIARRLHERTLKRFLIAVLFGLAPYLALHG